MRMWWVPVWCLFLPAAGLQAQRCMSQERLAQHVSTHPAAQSARLALESFTHFWAGDTPWAIGQRSVVSIPVVFHVVWRFPEENITDAQIFSQLQEMNKDFRLTNNTNGLIPAIFQPFAADMELTFCLAQRTPGGLATNGIVRVSTPVPFIGDRIAGGRKSVCYTADGGSDAWDPSRYVNIWVGRRQFFPAEASFPGGAMPGEDGIIIDPRFVGTTGTAASNQPYHLGRTLTHELGHYLNLYHLWGPGQPGSCSQSDEVADTPAQSKTYLAECPTHPQITCGSADMFMNFMNYTDDSCMAMFTQGQKARAWAALNGARPGLLDSDGCLPPVATAGPGAISAKLMGNPASRLIRLKMEGLEGASLNWRLTSVNGIGTAQGILTGASDAAIDVSGLPPGMYVLHMHAAAVRFAWKIIILP